MYIVFCGKNNEAKGGWDDFACKRNDVGLAKESYCCLRKEPTVIAATWWDKEKTKEPVLPDNVESYDWIHIVEPLKLRLVSRPHRLPINTWLIKKPSKEVRDQLDDDGWELLPVEWNDE